MNPFTKIWFWLLILSIIGFILSFIFFETMGETAGANDSTPIWIWIIFILSIIFLIVAFILYAIDLAAYNYNLEIAEACGELPPKKTIVCPKRYCVERPVGDKEEIEYIRPIVEKETIRCAKPAVERETIKCVKPAVEKETIKCAKPEVTITSSDCVDHSTTNINHFDTSKIVIESSEAFSAASLKPLESLAPVVVTNS